MEVVANTIALKVWEAITDLLGITSHTYPKYLTLGTQVFKVGAGSD